MVRLCLLCLRRFTPEPHEVIVIDNGSGDHPSLDYLRQVDWIRLLVREPSEIDPDPNRAHRDALQLGLEAASSPYILSLHTDAFVLREGWLSWMQAPMRDNARVGATGTYKLSYRPQWQQWLLDLKHTVRSRNPERPSTPFIRSHCALYDRAAMDDIGLGFLSDETAGRELYFTLLARGYSPALLPVRTMARYVAHINHGTMIVNPELCERKKTVSAGERRIQQFYASDFIQDIYRSE